jgi:molybdopterin synthase catalytic subunit
VARFEVCVQQEDFDAARLQSGLLGDDARCGGVVTFTGYVRSSNENRDIEALELEYYPGMTEKCIRAILEQAARRWPLLAVVVVHRVGVLRPGEQIVWVGASAAHREAAFAAAEFIMDYLKTRAPFWKKEHGPEGEHWVDARASDAERAGRWQ